MPCQMMAHSKQKGEEEASRTPAAKMVPQEERTQATKPAEGR